MNKFVVPCLAAVLLITLSSAARAQEAQSPPATDPDAHCVVMEKFVDQNVADQIKIEWYKTLETEGVEAVKKIFPDLPDPDRITAVWLFNAFVPKHPPEMGIAFGHDKTVCTWAIVPPQMRAFILNMIKKAEGVKS